MATLWHRLLRLSGEPRIRLPTSGLRPKALRPGDRLQIGSRLWRIEVRPRPDGARPDAARPDAARPDAAFELTAADGPPGGAVLRVAAGRWTLASEPGDPRAIELDPAGVIHFPLRAQGPGSDRS